MIESLRKNAKHIIFKIILVIIFVSILLTGIGNYLTSDNNNYAAKVNGQQISFTQLEQAVNIERKRQQESLDGRFHQFITDENYINNVRKTVLSQLIDEILLYQYADKLGLTISDEQIKQAIFSIPTFHTENRFDNNKFLTIIKNAGLSPDQYVALIRKHLLIQQIVFGIVNTNFLLPSEENMLLPMVAQIREARLIKLDITELAEKQKVNDDEILANYNTYKSNYISKEAFKVEYIKIDTEAIKKKITVTQEEIQAWYDHHRDQFIIPGRKRYSIIQIKNENHANECLKKLQSGVDFATLAKAYSTDVISAKNGGDIGWINDKDVFDELKQANLHEKGQLSDVIKSSLGFIIVYLNDVQPEKLSPIQEVYEEIIIKVKNEKITHAYQALKQKIRDTINISNKKTLESIEIVSGIKVQQTDWFSYDTIPLVFNYDVVKNIIFNGSLLDSDGLPGNNLDIITINDNLAFVMRIIDHRPEHIQPFENVQVRIKQKIKRQKALEQARAKAEEVLVVLKRYGEDTDILKKSKLTFSAPQQFYSFNQSDPLVQTIFSLLPPISNKSSYGISSNDQGDIVLIALDSVIQRTIEDQERKLIVKQLGQGIADISFDMLLINLRAKAKIKFGNWAL